MTPNEIEVLTHFHVRHGPHPRDDAPAVRDAIMELELGGLIKATGCDMIYETTDRGRAHIRQLCNLPLPEQAWIGANGEVVEGY